MLDEIENRLTHVGRATPYQLALFGLIGLIWGLTWIPTKVGVEWIPAALFAGVRGLVAGPLLLGLNCARGGSLAVPRADRILLFKIGLFTFALTYGLLFWGVGQVSSGLAAVVYFSLAPTLLLLFGALYGEDRVVRRSLVSTAIGITGVVVLYSMKIGPSASTSASLGLIAIVLATAAYDLGVVWSRPLLRVHSPMLIAGWSQLVGGLLLIAFSAATNPGGLDALRFLARPRVFVSWIFLVIFGSVIAFTLFLRLTLEWSPHRAGMYAFVSPVVAVIAGLFALNEQIHASELAGMALMMAGTLVALWPASRPRD